MCIPRLASCGCSSPRLCSRDLPVLALSFVADPPDLVLIAASGFGRYFRHFLCLGCALGLFVEALLDVVHVLVCQFNYIQSLPPVLANTLRKSCNSSAARNRPF